MTVMGKNENLMEFLIEVSKMIVVLLLWIAFLFIGDYIYKLMCYLIT